jgi:hypothetical protein
MKSALVGLVFILVIAMAVFIALGFTGVYDPWDDGEPTPTITPTPTGTPNESVGPISMVQRHLFDLAKGPEAYEYVLQEITYYDWDAENQAQQGYWEVYTSTIGGASIAHWYVYGIDTSNPEVYPAPGDPDATAIEHRIIELSAGY